MSRIDKALLRLFSIIILAITAVVVLIIYPVITVKPTVLNLITNLNSHSENITNVIILVNAILALFAIKGIFFQAKLKKATDGILLENKHGKLLISKESLQNLIKDLAKEIPGVENAVSRILIDQNNNLIVIADIVINKGVSIKEVTKILQKNIKVFVKQASDLEVTSVDINVIRISDKLINKEKLEKLEKLANSDKEIKEIEEIEDIEESESETETEKTIEVQKVEEENIEKNTEDKEDKKEVKKSKKN